MPVLHIVATPIGNLEDISLRAIRVLKEVAVVAAEDTRATRVLFRRYDIHTPLVSYTEHNHALRTPQLLKALEERDVALVSEAGMPALCDPGYHLVVAALEVGVRVTPIPGPSAITTALAASGLPADQFVFLGFLPRQRGERRRLLESVRDEPRTLVAFETPHRLQAALEDIQAALGDRRIAVCRELTKLYEEVFRGSVSDAQAHFTLPRGEFTLVIAGAQEQSQPPADPAQALAELARLRAAGVRAREAVDIVSQSLGLPRRDVYRLWLELARSGP